MTEAPENPPPDDKNWTWVLERPCPDCGFDPADYPRDRFGTELRKLAGRFRELLADERATLRPGPQVWSAVEYGCHLRDVFDIYLYRLGLMLNEDGPHFANWDQDETAVAERYWAQDPAKVSYDQAQLAGRLADALDHVRDDQWGRTGYRSDGVTFTIESFGRYFLHDPVHHVWDIERGYEALTPEPA